MRLLDILFGETEMGIGNFFKRHKKKVAIGATAMTFATGIPQEGIKSAVEYLNKGNNPHIARITDSIGIEEAEARRSHKNKNCTTWNHGKIRETELPQRTAPSWVVCPLAGQNELPPGFEMSSEAIRLAASAWYAPYKNGTIYQKKATNFRPGQG